jgi:hypothetical protein
MPTSGSPEPQEFQSVLKPKPKLVASDPKDKTEAAKEAFLDTVLNAKSLALEMLEDFRASDRFFKYKAAVLGTWVFLSIATVIVACPSAETAPTNELNARTRIQKVAALDRQITALFIENGGETEWGDLLLKLNGTYSAAVPGIPAGRSAVIQIDKFSASDGKTPPESLIPQRLDISCSQGEATIDLTKQ